MFNGYLEKSATVENEIIREIEYYRYLANYKDKVTFEAKTKQYERYQFFIAKDILSLGSVHERRISFVGKSDRKRKSLARYAWNDEDRTMALSMLLKDIEFKIKGHVLKVEASMFHDTIKTHSSSKYGLGGGGGPAGANINAAMESEYDSILAYERAAAKASVRQRIHMFADSRRYREINEKTDKEVRKMVKEFVDMIYYKREKDSEKLVRFIKEYEISKISGEVDVATQIGGYRDISKFFHKDLKKILPNKWNMMISNLQFQRADLYRIFRVEIEVFQMDLDSLKEYTISEGAEMDLHDMISTCAFSELTAEKMAELDIHDRYFRGALENEAYLNPRLIRSRPMVGSSGPLPQRFSPNVPQSYRYDPYSSDLPIHRNHQPEYIGRMPTGRVSPDYQVIEPDKQLVFDDGSIPDPHVQAGPSSLNAAGGLDTIHTIPVTLPANERGETANKKMVEFERDS
ncbi:MAG: hypothetical protein JWR43_2817 [Phenylobacterium sp.]|jgi:hypothetical protein|nr:hypothetical protein [Phenylobacterium sp.]